MTKPRLRTVTLTAAVGATGGTDKSVFSVAHLHCVDALVASARPVGATETATNGTGKPVPYKGAEEGKECRRDFALI